MEGENKEFSGARGRQQFYEDKHTTEKQIETKDFLFEPGIGFSVPNFILWENVI